MTENISQPFGGENGPHGLPLEVSLLFAAKEVNSAAGAPTLVEEQKQRSRDAYTYFVTASKLYPASVTAQAAHITEACHETQQLPLHLLNALLDDEAKIEQLQVVAEKAHQHAGKTMNIPLLGVMTVLWDDFSLADTMMTLPPGEVHGLLEREYPRIKERFSGDSVAIEAALRKELDRVLLLHAIASLDKGLGDTASGW